ncbi:uncharacterized protein Bfra_001247 [Botrytis fragariae]|uniref:Uncharacterized protein n=1 Tax=Botrytis fragariae TaxID=1964551 RepID=A0A8H6B0J3_9HELO|nr:uncharacterized protein Bfra_001247 [Botrytis fragariae]KAF5876892.1 hypothetical protein Bfra_001247 [Botrytis fragariae]
MVWARTLPAHYQITGTEQSNDLAVWERQAEKRREKRRKNKQRKNDGLLAKRIQALQSDTNEDTEMHDETGGTSTSRHPAAASMPPKKSRSESKIVNKREGVRERMKRRTVTLKDATAQEKAARKAIWKDYVANQKKKARDRKNNGDIGGEIEQQGEGDLSVGSRESMSGAKDVNEAAGENRDGMNSGVGLMFAGLAFRPKV